MLDYGPMATKTLNRTFFVLAGQKGGKARAKNLTATELSRIGKLGAAKSPRTKKRATA